MGGEDAYIEFDRNGRVSVRIGTQSTGQGHETSYAQLVADALGLDTRQVDGIQGDKDCVEPVEQRLTLSAEHLLRAFQA